MGLLGTIVKSAISLNHKFDFNFNNVKKEQEKVLLNLLKTSKNTSFGKYYGFQEILDSSDPLKVFKKNVPIHSYSDMQFWWSQQQKFPDITWPGKPAYFAKTSGTTGSKSKKIPITDDFSDSMRKVGISLASELADLAIPEEVFESDVLMLSSSSNLELNEKGFLEGEISGINTHNFPDWYAFFYRPGKEIASIDDWDERLQKIVKEAPNWNIGAIAGIPSWVLRMLQAIIKEYKLESIQEIWPNFSMYVSGGVAYETYRKDFEKISNKKLIIIDTYLASEGFFAYSAQPDKMSMKLALSHGYYYEFIPFDERGVNDMGEILDKPEILDISEVNTEDEYVLVVSTNAGAWRYIIGDTIQFTNLDPYELKITGRTKFFLNVFGSQLSEEKLDDAIVNVSEKLEVTVNEYMVAAVKDQNDKHKHQWVLVSNDKIDNNQIAESIDAHLKSHNNNYKVARNKTIDEVSVKVISKEQYENYLEQNNKKGGQVKTQKVMKASQMKDFLALFS